MEEGRTGRALQEPVFRRFLYTCEVHNTGPLTGDEVIMVYTRPSAAVRTTAAALHPVPLKQLVDFERLSNIKAGGIATIGFALEPTVLALTAANGSKLVYPGQHEIIFSTGDAAPDVVMQVTAA
jgi:hypothetical protein